MTDTATLGSPALPDDVHVVSVVGREALSELYDFEVGLMAPSGVAVDEAIAERALLQLRGADDRGLSFHGVIRAVAHVHEWDGRALWTAALVPFVHRLTLSRHSRVFVGRTVIDIVRDVFEQSGLGADDFSFQLTGSYPVHEHVCQYRESDFAFVARWLQREGLYYFFEQGDARERMVITDDKVFHHPSRGPVRYVPLQGGDAMASDAFETFRFERRVQPARVELDDYDYVHPKLDLHVESDVGAGGIGEVRSFGLGYATTDDGKRLAGLRAQSYLAQHKLYRAAGRVLGLRSGYTVDVEEHPRAAFNATYLVTELRHRANQSAGSRQICDLLGIDFEERYAVRAALIPAAVQYRHPDEPRWPRIDGYEIGVIDGPADSRYAQVDDHGRYKVKLRFDESGLDGGKASTWIRMLQYHAGATEGLHMPLRKGTEVLLLFLGGDPDRPVIAGAVPNAHTPAPVGGKNHTLNALVTGDGNRFELNDEKPWIDLYCPTEQSFLHLGMPHGEHDEHVVLSTRKDTLFDYGTDWDIEVGGEKFEHVVKDVAEQFNANHISHVGGYLAHTVKEFRHRYVEGYEEVFVGGTRKVRVEKNHTLETPETTIIRAGDAFIEMRSGYVRIDNGAGSFVELDEEKLWAEGKGRVAVRSPEGGIDVSVLATGTIKALSLEAAASLSSLLHVGSMTGEGPSSRVFVTGTSMQTSVEGMGSMSFADALTIDVGTDASLAAAGKLTLQGKDASLVAEDTLELGGMFVNTSSVETSIAADAKIVVASTGILEFQGVPAKIN